MNKLLEVIVFLRVVLSMLSLTILFVGLVIFVEMRYGVKGSWLFRWKIFMIVSGLSFGFTVFLTWLSSVVSIPSPSVMLSTYAAIFSYSLLLCFIITCLSTAISTLGFIFLWLKAKYS